MPQKTIIHGHFYQPNRESPWANIVLNQKSAINYNNWNDRIIAECYAPNGFSRILNGNGKIINILNNYQYMSFDFGPALLTYIEKNRPDLYDRILEADRKSAAARGGHGNAIASIYNHVIMSLASFEDKKTQIIWALKDFRYRFERPSEGMWLSECAVDYQTIDLLIEQGVKFIVLSPSQAKAFSMPDDNKWHYYDEKTKVDTTVAYKITRAHGSIAVFYYDKSLSSGVSFEHLLRDADNFAYRILHCQDIPEDDIQEEQEPDNEVQEIQIDNNNDPLAVIATDGEIYGHHEAYGDMCLSSLISKYYLDNKQIDLLNFAQYLEMYPPQYETLINLGDDNRGSSWSCPHGVARWYADCGCRTGGSGDWHQGWRTPLREAFDLVKTEADEIFAGRLKGLIDNPYELRNDYIDFILDNYDMSKTDFITKHAKKNLSQSEISMVLQLLYIQYTAMNMYTSCGWFFSEISGEETVQNIKYANTTVTLLEQFGSKIRIPFEEKMRDAKSNIADISDGKWILENWIYPNCLDYQHIVNNLVAVYRVNKSINLKDFAIFTSFVYKDLQVEHLSEDSSLFVGEIEVTHRRICHPRRFAFVFKALAGNAYKIFVSDYQDKDKLLSCVQELIDNPDYENPAVAKLSHNDLADEVKSYILTESYSQSVAGLINQNIGAYGDIRKIMLSYKNANVPLPPYLRSALLISADAFIADIAGKLTTFPTSDQYKMLLEIFTLIDFYKVTAHTKLLKSRITKILIDNLLSTDDVLSETYSNAIVLLQFCNQVGLMINRARIENIVFDILKNQSAKILELLPTITDENQRNMYMLQYKKLIIIADVCNISAGAERKKMMTYLTDSQIDNPYRF